MTKRVLTRLQRFLGKSNLQGGRQKEVKIGHAEIELKAANPMIFSFSKKKMFLQGAFKSSHYPEPKIEENASSWFNPAPAAEPKKIEEQTSTAPVAAAAWQKTVGGELLSHATIVQNLFPSSDEQFCYDML